MITAEQIKSNLLNQIIDQITIVFELRRSICSVTSMYAHLRNICFSEEMSHDW